MQTFGYFFARIVLSAIILGFIEGTFVGMLIQTLIGLTDPGIVAIGDVGGLEATSGAGIIGGFIGLVVFGIPSGILMGIVVGLYALSIVPNAHRLNSSAYARRIGWNTGLVALALALPVCILLFGFRYTLDFFEVFLPLGIPVLLAISAGGAAWFWALLYFRRAKAKWEAIA